MDTIRASTKPPPAPPPKPSHLSVAFTGTLNSDALRDYIKAQSTGGSTWSNDKKASDRPQKSSPNSDDEGEEDDESEDVFGTAKVLVSSPNSKQRALSKVPLRDLWSAQNRQHSSSGIAAPDSDGDDSDPHSTSHSRYVSTVSTIKPSPGKMSTFRTLGRAQTASRISGQGTIKNLPAAALETSQSSSPDASVSVSKWLEKTQSANGTVRGHHDRSETSVATVRPAVPEVSNGLSLDMVREGSPVSARGSPIDGLPRYSLASTTDGLTSIIGERSREPSILSRRDTRALADWEMHDHSQLAASPAQELQRQPSPEIENCQEESKDAELDAAKIQPQTRRSEIADTDPKAATPTKPLAPAGRPARALYHVQGEAAFNELSLTAGQTFRILDEELQGGWSLAIVEDPSNRGAWVRGLVPRGWYAFEREMAPPPPAEEEVAASRKNQDEGYLAPVVVGSSKIHAVGQRTSSQSNEGAEVAARDVDDGAQSKPQSTLLSVSHFLSGPSAGNERSKPTKISQQRGLVGLEEDNASNTGTAKSAKQHTRATAALSQLMAPSLSASGASSGSRFMSRSPSAGNGAPSGSHFLKSKASMSPPTTERRGPVAEPAQGSEVSNSIDSDVFPHRSERQTEEDTVQERDADVSITIIEEPLLEPNGQEVGVKSAPQTAQSPNLVTPFYRTVKRFSPFVTSGAEAYLLSRELGVGKPKPSVSANLEGGSIDSDAEPDVVHVQHQPEAPADTHEIVIGPNAELRWKDDPVVAWVEVHSPAYIEGRQSEGWLRLREAGFVTYQVTTRSLDLSGESLSAPLDPILTPRQPTSTLTVSRRFRHFSQLAAHLTTRYSLLTLTAIPPLPAKSHSKRFDATFLEARKRELWNWLERVTRHPVLRKDEVVNAFLTVGSTHGSELAEGEEGLHAHWDMWMADFLAHEKRRKQDIAKDPAVEFFAHTYHPEFAIDRDEVETEINRAEEWSHMMEGRVTGSRGAKRDPEPLLKAVKGMRDDVLQTSQAYRDLGRSLLRASSGPGSEDAGPSDEHARVRAGGGWCWRDGCVDCAPLSTAMQALADTLQDVAQLHDEQARYHLLPVHERLWNISQPHGTTASLFEVHRSTLEKYALALKADDSASTLKYEGGCSSNGSFKDTDKARPAATSLPVETAEHLASGAETVLNVLQGELQYVHDSQLRDWRKIGTSLLDEQIGFYEDVLGKLRGAREAFADDAWRIRSEEARALQHGSVIRLPSSTPNHPASPYLDELKSVRPAPPPPLPQPTTQILPPSTLSGFLRPVGLAGEVVLGMFSPLPGAMSDG